LESIAETQPQLQPALLEIVSDHYPIFHARDATCFGYSRSSWIGTHSRRDKFVPKKSGDTGLQSATTFRARLRVAEYNVTGVFKGKRAILN
jgi:hypothetical protein